VGDIGSLHVRSAEAIASIRGLGSQLKGVIINEAAHLDLAEAWRRVIRPLLMDNQGWALIMSTPNRGTDGGVDEQGVRRVPSYFNTLCEQVKNGYRGEEWAYFTGDARENPKIAASEFQALVAEYPQDSVALQEEVYAKLMPPGTGLAFQEWRDDLHILADEFRLPSHWIVGAGFDWGYWQPSVLVLVAQDEFGRGVAFRERQWTQTTGLQMGRDIAQLCKGLGVQYIASDSSIRGVSGQKGWPNQAEEIQGGILEAWDDPANAPPMLVDVPKDRNSRLARAQLLHRYLRWQADEDGTIPVQGQPALKVARECRYLATSLPKLPPDPLRPEDVDTDADDHGYDALTYYLMTRPQPAEAPQAPRPQDVHPGLDPRTGRRKLPTEPEPIRQHYPKYRPTGPMQRL